MAALMALKTVLGVIFSCSETTATFAQRKVDGIIVGCGYRVYSTTAAIDRAIDETHGE